MDNQPNTVLQNTTNVYTDGSTLHAFFQRHKRPSDDGTTGPLSKKPKVEVTTESQETELQGPIEDVVEEEEVRTPRTNTFKMLRNMYRARNVLAQPSSACTPGIWRGSRQELMTATSTNEQDIGELCLIRESGHILLSLCQGRCFYLATIHLRLF